MLLKLSLAGMKGKLKDYFVLLSGLVMTISVFYMFQTLSWNTEFIKSNAMIRNIQLVFIVGSVLLSVVTILYMLYTNSFLLSLRQKQFGMYMMLGAKKKSIKKIMFVETMVIGCASLVIGITVGIGLAFIVGYLLAGQLNITLEGYQSFYLPAVLATFIFFIVVFLCTALINHIKLSRVQVLQLIYSDVHPDDMPIQKKKNSWLILLGLISLSLGYVSLIFMEKLREIGLFAAPTFTTLGTYLLFIGYLPVIVNRMQANKRWTSKGVTSFTFAQLNFRIQGLTKILATVAMLIALGAGAISAGLAFKNSASQMAEMMGAYDVIIKNPNAEEKALLKNIHFTEENQYRFKEDPDYTYYLRDDLENQRPLLLVSDGRKPKFKRVTEDLPEGKISLSEVKNPEVGQQLSDEWDRALWNLRTNYRVFKQMIVLDSETYHEIQGQEKLMYIGKSDKFTDYLHEWQGIDKLALEKDPILTADDLTSKYSFYNMYSSFTSGTMFMGFFLGIAFLAMMASCLMFKILSGASKDTSRYQMLRKIGVRRSALSTSIYKELFIIFLFPAMVGLAHVLIGMNMFSFIILNPYYRIWVPIIIFLIIYCLYYVITVKLYKQIVLPKE
ncbi:FtsX-like permease family protein [Peribacillus huizhouensis]|uniref:ABC transport system permease protein n=1 Tax=Peribacillus huizhouensis TaxID=1501239 RepID=A0ABR6CNH2_9BACI|nr:FtsX-like permease family protein [Peribacillus huizhouensis]MBA9026203.1 putative ABC transport system permease protein [Peribacillus huizhouensis]